MALHHAALYETLLLRYQAQGMVSTPADTGRLNDLLLHARLGNADYLSYALRSVARKLADGGRLSAGEELVLSLLRQWLNGTLRPDALAGVALAGGSPADQLLLRNVALRPWVGQMTGNGRNVP